MANTDSARPIRPAISLTHCKGLMAISIKSNMPDLPWPDEAARFMMLWLTGLMAPVAMRQGGMVAITSVLESFPRPLFKLTSLMLLCLSLLVLIVGFQLGWKHVNSGWLFSSSSLKVPLFLIGMKSVKIKLAWMYMSLFTGVCLMILVKYRADPSRSCHQLWWR